MSITSWAKRSASANSWILAVVIGSVCLNLYYRDRPVDSVAISSQSQNMDFGNGAIATNPKIKAFLMTIRWAEGTAGEDGYRTIFGYGTFDDFEDHPRRVQVGGNYRSDAAGAYQAMSFTWDRIAAKINLKDFSPANQDRFAVELLRERSALKLIEAGDIQGAIAASCEEWASFPCFNGDTQGAYKQPVKPMPALLQQYKYYLEKNN